MVLGRFGLRVLCCGVLGLAAVAPVRSDASVLWGGSVYEYVPTAMKWDQARLAAESMDYLGFPGRLATVTSAQEHAAVLSILPAGSYYAMLGANDAAQEGTWAWQTGPEAGTVFWKDGQPTGGQFNAWRPGEPNAYYPDEDYLVIYQGGWNDAPVNSSFAAGFVVEYRLGREGFDFGMSLDHLGAVRNLAPEARLVALDIRLAGDTFIDSAATAPGTEYSPWALVDMSPGASWIRPDSAATDGRTQVTVQMDLAPLEELHFQVDIDRFGSPDGPGLAVGTIVTAHFELGDLHYTATGTVGAGGMHFLDETLPYSVRAMNTPPVPEPGAWLLFAGGLLPVLGAARRRSSRQPCVGGQRVWNISPAGRSTRS